MLILMVATSGSYPIPPIFLYQLNDVPYLHEIKIVLQSKTINIG